MRARLAIVLLGAAAMLGAAAYFGQDRSAEQASDPQTQSIRPAPLRATAAPARPERVCLRAVIDDWYSDGVVDRSHRRGCYAAALGALPRRDHSNVDADLRGAYERAAVSNVVDEEESTFRTLGLGSPAAEVEAVLGPGETDGGFAPVGSLPAEVAVPFALPNPPGVREPPRLLRYGDRAFLLARGRAFAMMITSGDARTRLGIRIGDGMAKVRDTYPGTDCYRAPGGERLGGGTVTYPVCRVSVAPKRYLSFGGDPVRSFTFFSREAP